MSDFNMDQVIQVTNDPEISSCHELEEMRQEAERVAIAAVQREMDVILRVATADVAKIDEHTAALQRQLDTERLEVSVLRDSLDTRHEMIREQLMEMLDLQTQISKVSLDTVNLLSSLQEIREQNHAAITADPIYALVQEERELQQRLDELGIYVHPPTDSDEHYQ